MNRLAAVALSIMAACAPLPQDPPPSRAVTLEADLPPTKSFPDPFAAPASRANADMVQDFLDLSFRMESGKAIPVMTRFEGPIAVRIAGPATQSLSDDLDALLNRLRREAGLNIALSDNDGAQIVVEAVPQAVLQRAVPRAACFVVPRISSWDEFLIARRTGQIDWTTLTKRDRVVMFVPADAAPQEVRDCLHEELAQALGPLNDLYRLPDSVFNDDNIHAVLTGFDMLMLRAYYAPELRNGMSRQEAAAVLPRVFARMNPGGERHAKRAEHDTTREWIDAMELALTSGAVPARRRAAAQQAIQMGQRLGWSGTREGFAYYAYGRLQVGNDADSALSAFQAADKIYRQSPTTRIHVAHIAVQKSAFALRAGDAQATLQLAEDAIPIARQHQNAALLATLMMFKAEALDMIGNTVAASEVRLDSLGWARYGFGADTNVQARLNEIAALRPF